MRSPLVSLVASRRFAPLFVTQFLGAFNDNLLKSALGIFVTYRLADRTGITSSSLVMMGSTTASRMFESPAPAP